jgi:hypothetical protein
MVLMKAHILGVEFLASDACIEVIYVDVNYVVHSSKTIFSNYANKPCNKYNQ